LPDQRLTVLTKAASGKLLAAPGTTLLYSNLGYMLVGAIIERVGGQPWERAIRERLFTPLGMTRCGFGGVGTPGTIDQPWPHDEHGKPMPRNGPIVDNPPALGPAGTVHCSMADWSRFLADQLRGARGEGALLKPATYTSLHTPRFGDGVAFGWGTTPRAFGGGIELSHWGGNGMNEAYVWVAPLRDFAVLAVTNQGGAKATAGINAAADALIRLHTQP
jgi:CubicO group peptidase (beta-lactamase class C family)